MPLRDSPNIELVADAFDGRAHTIAVGPVVADDGCGSVGVGGDARTYRLAAASADDAALWAGALRAAAAAAADDAERWRLGAR